MVMTLAPVKVKAGYADLGLAAIEDLLSATMLAQSIALTTGDLEAVMEAQAPLKELLEAREEAVAASGPVVPLSANWEF